MPIDSAAEESVQIPGVAYRARHHCNSPLGYSPPPPLSHPFHPSEQREEMLKDFELFPERQLPVREKKN